MIPILIVAHAKRRKSASNLVDLVNADAVTWDISSRLKCEGNHLQGWEFMMHTESPWVCVLEDDAIPCLHFREQLDMVVKHASTDIISLYLGRGRPSQWQIPISSVISTEVCFIRSDTLLSTVGYVVRTEVLREMYQVLDPNPWPKLELPEQISKWARANRKPVSYCRPSIIQHRDAPSIIPVEDRPDGQERTEMRKAWLFDWREEWNSTYVDLPRPDLRRKTG